MIPFFLILGRPTPRHFFHNIRKFTLTGQADILGIRVEDPAFAVDDDIAGVGRLDEGPVAPLAFAPILPPASAP